MAVWYERGFDGRGSSAVSKSLMVVLLSTLVEIGDCLNKIRVVGRCDRARTASFIALYRYSKALRTSAPHSRP